MPRLFWFSHGHDNNVSPDQADGRFNVSKPLTVVSTLKIQRIRRYDTDYCDESLTSDLSQSRFDTMAIHQKQEILESLNMMLIQEKDSYLCRDYFNDVIVGKKVMVGSPTTRQSKKVDELCREQISEWAYRVTDFFQISRDVVYISMSYLDRFMVAHEIDRATYKLAATTCLLLAIKVHHSKRIPLADAVFDLSRGEFDVKDICNMERLVLETLAWRLHPPTPCHYIPRLLLLPTFSSKTFKDMNHGEVHSFAFFFAELSVLDYYFVTQRSSVIAIASILNALEGLGIISSPHSNSWFMHRSDANIIHSLSKFLDLDADYPLIDNARQRLWQVYERSEEFTQSVMNGRDTKDRSFLLQKIEKMRRTIVGGESNTSSSTHSSPRSVARCTDPTRNGMSTTSTK